MDNVRMCLIFEKIHITLFACLFAGIKVKLHFHLNHIDQLIVSQNRSILYSLFRNQYSEFIKSAL